MIKRGDARPERYRVKLGAAVVEEPAAAPSAAPRRLRRRSARRTGPGGAPAGGQAGAHAERARRRDAGSR